MKQLTMTAMALAAAALTAPGLADQADQDLDVLAHWTFDDTSGGTSADRGPHGIEATLSDGATLAEAPGGSAVSFPAGSGGYVQLPASDAFNLRGPFTLAAWVLPQGDGQMEVFCLKTDSLDRGYRLRSFWGQAVFEVGVGQPEPVAVKSEPNALIKDNWAHVAVTWDGQALTMWINAEPVARTPLTSPPTPYNGGQPVIGNYLTAKTAYPFVGRIDDVVLLSQAADADTVYRLASQRESGSDEPR